MRVVRTREIYEAGDRFTLWPISDAHLGAIDTDEDALRAHVAAIDADPYARWIYLGDIGDLIDHRDAKRFHPGMLPQRYQDAMFAEGGIPTEVVEHAVEIFEPIKKKCWAWLSGNHEATVRKKYDRELGSEISGRLGVEYLGYGGFLKVDFAYAKSTKRPDGSPSNYQPLVFDLHHGWQGGRRSGAVINQLELELGYSDADIIFRGHSHQRVAQRFNSTRIGSQYPRPWPRIVAHCGSYKVGRVDKKTNGELHDTWEHTRGFRQQGLLGPPLIMVDPSTPQNRHAARPKFDFTIQH